MLARLMHVRPLAKQRLSQTEDAGTKQLPLFDQAVLKSLPREMPIKQSCHNLQLTPPLSVPICHYLMALPFHLLYHIYISDDPLPYYIAGLVASIDC